jgi:hypothetical protein
LVEHQCCATNLVVSAVGRDSIWMTVDAQTSVRLTVDQRMPCSQHTLRYIVFFLMGAEMFLVYPLLPTR